MASRIKGITIELNGDATGLDKALEGVNKNLNSTKLALRDVNRMLKIDPTNTELLAQKQRLLKEAIQETGEKLTQLKDADKQAKAQMEAGTLGKEKYEAIRREVIETENNLKNLNKQLEGMDSASDAATKAEKKIEKLKDEVKEVEKSNGVWSGASEKISVFGDKAKAASEKVKPLSMAMTAVTTAAFATIPATEEYRKIMASLEVSSQNAGYTTEQTTETFKTLYGVLADDQTAATTTANLQALGLEQSKLTEITNGAIGAWATYGDSIPIDGLAESINETIKTAKVTGNFADVLNWAGTSEDKFNEKLEACATETDRTNLVLQELASQGLIDAGKAWQENNKSLVESNKATISFKDATAELAETLTPIVTKVTEVVTGLINGFNSLSPEMQGVVMAIVAIVAVAAPLLSLIGSIAGGISLLMSPITGIILIIMAVIAVIVLAYAKCEWFRDGVNAVVEAVVGFFKNLWKEAEEKFKNIQKTVEVAITTITLIFTMLREKAGEIWNNMVKNIGETVGKIPKIVKEGFAEAIEFITSLPGKAIKWGTDFIDGMVKGIKNAAHKVVDAAKGIADGIAGFLHFSRPDEGPLHEYETWMPDFIDGMVRTLKKNQYKIVDATKGMAGEMADGTMSMNVLATAGNPSINLESSTMVQIGNESIDGYIAKTAVKGINKNRLNSQKMKGRK